MSSARTIFPIVVWAARARRARSLEMLLAGTLGDCVGAVRDPPTKTVLARHARHHAHHAELWDGIVPVLHDVTVSDLPDDDPGLARVVAALAGAVGDGDPAVGLRRAFDDAIPALVEVYREWANETSVVADRPVMRVLDLVLRDEEFDLREGQALTGSM